MNLASLCMSLCTYVQYMQYYTVTCMFMLLYAKHLRPHVSRSVFPLQLINDVYGPILVAPEEGYDVSVQFDLENLPDNPGKVVVVEVIIIVCVCV